MGLFSVYKHVSPSGKVYIGLTSQSPEDRWKRGKAYYQNKHFSSAINRYGWENFTHEIVCDGLSKEDACAKEKELIAQYKSNDRRFGYNNSTGGENPAEGVKMSDETKHKMSVAHRGKKQAPDFGKKISNAKKGKPNGREGKVGKECSQAGIVFQIDELTKNVVSVFYGYDEMNRMTGFAKTPVKEAVSGVRKRAYGYLWAYQKRGKANVAI